MGRHCKAGPGAVAIVLRWGPGRKPLACRPQSGRAATVPCRQQRHKMKKRTEITIETSRRVIVRHSSNWRQIWCERCLTHVRMISPNEAAARLNVSSRVIYQWIEEGSIHFREEPGGLIVCETSLPPQADRLLT